MARRTIAPLAGGCSGGGFTPPGSEAVIGSNADESRHGAFGTALVATLPSSLGSWGYVTGIEMTLSRKWSAGGRRHSYLSACCPAPGGFSRVNFPLARAGFVFAGGTKLSATLNRSCRARG